MMRAFTILALASCLAIPALAAAPIPRHESRFILGASDTGAECVPAPLAAGVSTGAACFAALGSTKAALILRDVMGAPISGAYLEIGPWDRVSLWIPFAGNTDIGVTPGAEYLQVRADVAPAVATADLG